MSRLADFLQLAGLVLLVMAGFSVALPLGLFAAGVAGVVVGLAVDPRVKIRGKSG